MSRFVIAAAIIALSAGHALANGHGGGEAPPPPKPDATTAAGADVASGFSRTYVRRLLFLAALPTIATLLFEWTTGQMPSNMVRAAAGLPLGAAVAWIVGKVN